MGAIRMSDDKNTPERVADSVMRRIESLILEGSLRPDEALLPERELAMKLQVSRPKLREALKALEEQGLLTSKEGRGVKVARIGAQSITDPLMALLAKRGEIADDYLEFRDVVESSAAEMAALRANDLDLQRLEECLQRIDAAHLANAPEAEAEADAELHIAIYEASHNLVLLQIMRALAGNLRADVFHNRRNIFAIPAVRDMLRAQHLAIGKAILEKRPQDARAAAHEHLAYLRRMRLEIREAEAQRSLSLRRRDSGGLSARRTKASET